MSVRKYEKQIERNIYTTSTNLKRLCSHSNAKFTHSMQQIQHKFKATQSVQAAQQSQHHQKLLKNSTHTLHIGTPRGAKTQSGIKNLFKASLCRIRSTYGWSCTHTTLSAPMAVVPSFQTLKNNPITTKLLLVTLILTLL